MGVIICVLYRNLLHGYINGPLSGIILHVQDCALNESCGDVAADLIQYRWRYELNEGGWSVTLTEVSTQWEQFGFTAPAPSISRLVPLIVIVNNPTFNWWWMARSRHANSPNHIPGKDFSRAPSVHIRYGFIIFVIPSFPSWARKRYVKWRKIWRAVMGENCALFDFDRLDGGFGSLCRSRVMMSNLYISFLPIWCRNSEETFF